MIQAMSHVCIYVEDQERALEFYTEKLGFVVSADVSAEGMRWLTVASPDQDLELILMEPQPNPMMDDETIEQLRTLMRNGALGNGVFRSEDCRATHAELSERGVEFVQEPTERPYGIEAMFRDDSGNVFALVEPAEAEYALFEQESELEESSSGEMEPEQLDFDESQTQESEAPSGNSEEDDSRHAGARQGDFPQGGERQMSSNKENERREAAGGQQSGGGGGGGGKGGGGQGGGGQGGGGGGGKQSGGSEREREREGGGKQQGGGGSGGGSGGKQSGGGGSSGGGSKRS